jgi:hypothetical protein
MLSNSPKTLLTSLLTPNASPKATSPKVTSPKVTSPKVTSPRKKEKIHTLGEWIDNMYVTLIIPAKILTVFALILIGTYVEISPRKSIEILESQVLLFLLFCLPFFFVYMIDWPTGLLAATIVVITYSRLQKQDSETEGFTTDTSIVSESKQWLAEQMLGETNVATINKTASVNKTNQTSTNTSSKQGSSMSSNRSSGGTK